MAKRCSICGKGPQFGHRISHAHNVSKRRWNPNVRKVRLVQDGHVKRAYVCTDCLSAGKVIKPS
jgi:large subunit ribosomal protein L28